MVQFKPYFLGLQKPPSLRLASCQKCFRTTDIDYVGDKKHLTFFEMLGNFSVGDYFKEEAISWAWEFVTEYLKLDRERLWITIYLDDDEAFKCWREIGIPAGRILRFGDEDNFWGPAGGSGPCGPCSEIHYDLGKEFGCGKPECKPNCECGRFSEIWNLVFTQYNQTPEGKRLPLSKPNIDTGMGLERALAVVQGKPSPYETDLFLPLLESLSRLAGKSYGKEEEVDRAMRIVVEHGRGLAFLIADGVLPSNEGRGYVLRRILRRASLFGRRLGLDEPFLAEIATVAVDTMGQIYPELEANRSFIEGVIKQEEEGFRRGRNIGMGILEGTIFKLREELAGYFPEFQDSFENALSQQDFIDLRSEVESAIGHFRRDCEAWGHVLSVGERDAVQESLKPIEINLTEIERIISEYQARSRLPAPLRSLKESLRECFRKIKEDVDLVARKLTGFEVFILHDTYGFDCELTAEIAAERGLSVDLDGFKAEMERQRERARTAQKFVADEGAGKDEVKVEHMEFTGYETTVSRSRLLELRVKGRLRKSAHQDDEVDIILDRTPFYGEMGGQVGDTGKISSSEGEVVVTNTVRTPSEAVIHRGRVTKGSISTAAEVEAAVDVDRRRDIARNHTATHLLQAALRAVLGGHVYQRGSLVEPGRFRFDFSHLAVISEQQLAAIQSAVNERIRQNLPVKARVVPYEQAIGEGAIALFEEKYGDTVRMVEIGEPEVSRELCGGTHVSSTGEIGLFVITSEASIGTGLHRIEAVTGRAAEALINKNSETIKSIAREMKSLPEEVYPRLKSLIDELDSEQKHSLWLERELSRKIAEALVKRVKRVGGAAVVAAEVPSLAKPVIREMGDILRGKLKSAVIILATTCDGDIHFLAMVTPDLVARGIHADKIVRRVARVTGGSGGGKPEMAQAGGKDITRLDEALDSVVGIVREEMSPG
jgi:alanyl-tRNA synthetase